MSASENQDAETSKDAVDRKVDCPWNIIHIRLPQRKRLSDASLILSKKVPRNSSNTGSKELSEPITDNPGKNWITRLCNEANSNITSKSVSAESESDISGNKLLAGANVSILSENLRVAAEEQGSDASSYAAKDGLCEEANSNNPSMILPLPVQEIPEDNIDSSPRMNLSASVGQAVEQSTNAANFEVRKLYQEFEEKIQQNVYIENLSHQATEAKTNPGRTLSTTPTESEVCEHTNHLIPTKKFSDVARNRAPSNRPTHPAKKSTPCKKPRTSPVQATDTSQKTSTMKISTSDGQAVNRSKSAADLEAVKQYQEFEEKVKRTVYLDNLSDQATEAVIKAALSQFCTIRKVRFVVNYTIPYNIPQSALVEMESKKDAEAVVSMLHDFPFMMSGMPRPVRAIHATAEMFNDRPRRPGSELKFCWVKNTDPDYAMVKRLKFLSRKHEVENLALIEHELEEEKLLAAKQQENLNVNYKMMKTMDSVLLSGMPNYLSNIYNVS